MESMLSGIGNKLINDNYKIFLDELVPGLEVSLARIFADIVNTILKDSTYDEMFPE
jgi:Haemolymph juvenile hormone binding protein (JHBP)